MPRRVDGAVSEWERHAAWWVERFTDGADAEYDEQILPLIEAELAGARSVLDVGCGEGQLARVVAAQGARTVGIDGSWNQLAAARQRGGGPSYGRAVATSLPFAEASFDGAIVCLVLEHLDELDAVAGEIARVLVPGGRLCCVLNHPLMQTPGSGLIDDSTVEPPERYWRVGPYLVEQAGDEQVERDVFIRFVHRPLSRYVNAFSEVGLVIERMVEPWPPDARRSDSLPLGSRQLDSRQLDSRAAAVPRLLYLRFVARR